MITQLHPLVQRHPHGLVCLVSRPYNPTLPQYSTSVLRLNHYTSQLRPTMRTRGMVLVTQCQGLMFNRCARRTGTIVCNAAVILKT